MRCVYSFLVDGDVRFGRQAQVFLTTLLACGVSPDDIVCHYTDTASDEVVRRIRKAGVMTMPIGRFLDGAFCNKILQLAPLQGLKADFFVLCDTDLAFLQGVDELLIPGCVRGKPVDFPNPEIWVLEEIRQALGVGAPPRRVMTLCDQQETWDINCNGGLYIIPAQYMGFLSDCWVYYAQSMERFSGLLADKYIHIDQISFAMAMLETGFNFYPLPDDFNFPTHSVGNFSEGISPQPKILHYHFMQHDNGLLKNTGHEQVDAAIERVNRLLA